MKTEQQRSSSSIRRVIEVRTKRYIHEQKKLARKRPRAYAIKALLSTAIIAGTSAFVYDSASHAAGGEGIDPGYFRAVTFTVGSCKEMVLFASHQVLPGESVGIAVSTDNQDGTLTSVVDIDLSGKPVSIQRVSLCAPSGELAPTGLVFQSTRGDIVEHYPPPINHP